MLFYIGELRDKISESQFKRKTELRETSNIHLHFCFRKVISINKWFHSSTSAFGYWIIMIMSMWMCVRVCWFTNFVSNVSLYWVVYILIHILFTRSLPKLLIKLSEKRRGIMMFILSLKVVERNKKKKRNNSNNKKDGSSEPSRWKIIH